MIPKQVSENLENKDVVCNLLKLDACMALELSATERITSQAPGSC